MLRTRPWRAGALRRQASALFLTVFALLTAAVFSACGGDSAATSASGGGGAAGHATNGSTGGSGQAGGGGNAGNGGSGGGHGGSGGTSTSQLPDPKVTFFELSKDFKPNKLVFAHYMLCCGSFGDDVAAFEKDIRLAEAMGLDGFAINSGGWSNTNYPGWAANLFQAATNVGGDFKLFFSADMCCGLTAPDLVDMITKYGDHPRYLKKDNKAVFSTYAGGSHSAGSIDFWDNQVRAPLASAGHPIFFVPFFYPDPVSELPNQAAVQANVDFWKDHVEGMFNFGAAGLPYGEPSIFSVNRDLTASLHAAGKLAMASYSATYWGAVQDPERRYFEDQGGLGAEQTWKGIVADDPEWVEITTWNDRNESYMMPIDDFQKYHDIADPMYPVPIGWYKPHYGYAELVRYYMQWFKTGKVPHLTRDSIFYAYRTHKKDAVATADGRGAPTAFIGDVSDSIYLTIPLTAKAELRVTSGGTTKKFELPAGMNQKTVPFEVGAQHFELWRGDKKINAIDGEPVVDAIELYDYWNTTGFVETTP